MKHRVRCSIAIVASLAAVGACGTQPQSHGLPADALQINTDGGEHPDTALPDVFGSDASALMDVVPGADAMDAVVAESGIDAALDAPAELAIDVAYDSDAADDAASNGDGADAVPMDVPVGDPCESGSIIDLTTLGDMVGSTTTYSGTTDGLLRLGAIPGACIPNVGYEIALAYMASTTSYLRVSTVNSGTPTTFDTVVWIIDTCDPSGASLGCDNDASSVERRSTFVTPQRVTAGTLVYIILAGYVPERAGLHASGSYEITVTEVPEIAMGTPCDPSSMTNVCIAGTHCIADTPPATCVADGTLGGQCAPPDPGCMSGLGCNNDILSPMARCVPQVPRGHACDLTMRTNVCATGAFCVDLGMGAFCH
jgi:hypothetical protein